MENATTVSKVAFSPPSTHATLQIYQGARCWNNKCSGRLFSFHGVLFFPPSLLLSSLPLSVPVLTIYRHPASSRKLFRQAFKACLVSPVVTLTSKRRLHFLFSISRRRVPRDAFDADSTGIRGGNAKFTSIVDGCALLKR